MRSRLIPFLFVACLLAGCREPAGVEGLSAPAATGVRLPSGAQLQVVGCEGEEARWLLLEAGNVSVLEPPPVALFPIALSRSPNGRFLAVLSAGEGHPMVDVLEVTRVLEGRHGTRSLCLIDPYPGTISLAGWKGNTLRLHSDRPLQAPRDANGRPSGTEVLDELRSFLLTVETGDVQPE